VAAFPRLTEHGATPKTAAAPRALAEDAITEAPDMSESMQKGPTTVDPEIRHEMIATMAYYIAEQRAFEPGHSVDDWCAAAEAVDATLARIPTPGTIAPADSV
jgi:hypothetical protein